MNSPTAVVAVMLIVVLSGRNSTTRFLSGLRATGGLLRCIANVVAVSGVTLAILGPILIGCHR